MQRQKIIHRIDLDILKALSIIAVVFYHIGWLETGYLGVDVFFAINGFFVIPSLVDSLSTNSFNYISFLRKRIMRLWPLVLLAGAVCLGIGYVGMLPDDYDNLSQSVIASNFMSQNILSAITTTDYWDVSNEFKPLMHFWYVGILVELYLLLPLVLMLVRCLTKKVKHSFVNIASAILALLALGSVVIYLHPETSMTARFYYLPSRLWEILLGGLIGIWLKHRTADKHMSLKWAGCVAIMAIILVLCSSLYMPYSISRINAVNGLVDKVMLIPQNILLIMSVLFTCVLLLNPVKLPQNNRLITLLAYVGQMSFSIFVWHQILLAFYRYFYGSEVGAVVVAALWLITIVLSIITYRIIEQKVAPTWKNFIICCVALVVICLPAGIVYVKAGVVRDVPELNVYVGQTHKGQFAEYCDRVYGYNVDFPANEKINVLVEGISFGRDFANVLLESQQIDNINLSYIYLHDEKHIKRYSECDYLFTFKGKDDVPQYVWDMLNPEAKVFGIGTKNYGGSNGVVYKYRNSEDYFTKSVFINPNFHVINNKWKTQWGEEYYIDLIQLSSLADGSIRVFTDDNKYISQDCSHLTQDGAKWYAQKIDWKSIFK